MIHDAHDGAQALLVTGEFGTGKSSVAVEVGDLLEEAGRSYAVLDLDFLAWVAVPSSEPGIEHRLLLENLAAVASNYQAAGVRYFVLARFFDDAAQLEELRAVLSMPLTVVRLTAPIAEIERRLSADPTSGRQDDLAAALARSIETQGVGTSIGEIADLSISNEGELRDVALSIIELLGWASPND